MKHILLTISLVVTAVSGYAAQFNGQFFSYEPINDTECQVTDLSDYFISIFDYASSFDFSDMGIEELTIPSTVKNGDSTYTVTAIAEKAFWCTKHEDRRFLLKKLILPPTLKTIGDMAFGGALIDTIVVNNAFPPKANMRALCQNPSLFEFDHMYRFNVKEVVIPEGSLYRYQNAPGWCWIKTYKEDKLNPSDTNSSAYIETDGWVASVLDNEAHTVELNYCIAEPDSIVFPETLTVDNTTYTVKSLGPEVISNRPFQSTVYVPQSIERLPDGVFFEVKAREITGMENVSVMEENIFSSTYLRRLVIPKKITVIPSYLICFTASKYFDYIELHENVTKIMTPTFYGVWIHTMVCHAVTPPESGKSMFDGNPGTLLVPAESVEAYRNAPGWNLFREIKAIDGSAIEEISTDNASEAPEYYNLQGVKIANPTPGTICIERRGTQARKIKL